VQNSQINAQVGATLPLRGIIGAIVGELGQFGGYQRNLVQFFRGRGQKTIFSELFKNVLTSSSEKSIICFVKLKNKYKKGGK
jgi:hypothetical protein